MHPTLRKAFSPRRLVEYLSVTSIVVVVVMFTSLNPNFLGVANLKNIFSDVAPVLCMALGLTFVLLAGAIDLSVGAVCTCACVLTGTFFPVVGNWIIPLVVLYGVFAGAVNGVVFTSLRIPSFIVTLCTMSIWKCVALLVSRGTPTMIPFAFWRGLRWARVTVGVFPALFLISVGLLGAFLLVQRSTVFGKAVYAVGANERAARMMGLDVGATMRTAFILSGIGSAASGIFYAIILRSSLPTVGDSMTLVAIAAVALGGTALSGGRGGVLKTLLGVVLVMVIQNGLNVVAVDAFWQQVVYGVLVLVAVYLNGEKGGGALATK